MRTAIKINNIICMIKLLLHAFALQMNLNSRSVGIMVLMGATLASILSGVDGYPTGLISAACQTMTPGHGAAFQTDPPPFEITVSPLEFDEDDEISGKQLNINCLYS